MTTRMPYTNNSLKQVLSFLLLAAPLFLPARPIVGSIGNGAAYDVEVSVVGFDNEPLVMAHVYCPNVLEPGRMKFSGNTDEAGKITITGLKARDTIFVSYVGYSEFSMELYKVMRDLKGIIKLNPIALSEVVVTAPTKFATNEKNIPSLVRHTSSKDIALRNPQTTATAIENTGTYVQRTQMGGGSPVIRGFEANKVLLILDGVRLNNAIYRSGHLQNSITIDNNALERIEVIQGPAAVVYGSDALGGVMSLQTKDPKLQFDPSGKMISEGGYFVRYATANQEKTLHLNLNLGGHKWGGFSSFTYTDFNSLHTGKRTPAGLDSIPDHWLRHDYVRMENGDDIIVKNPDPHYDRIYNLSNNTQRKEGYGQLDFLQKIRFKPNDDLYFTANFQFSNSSDIPRFDNLNSYRQGKLRFAEWHYGPQIRLLGALRTDIFKKNKFFDQGIVLFSYQYIEEDRYQRTRNSPWRERQMETLYIGAANLDFMKDLGDRDRNRISYGLAFDYNYLNSAADRLNIASLKRIPFITRYPDGGSATNTLAAYASHYWSNKRDDLNIISGLRYTIYNLDSKYQTGDPETQLIAWPFNEIQIKNRARLTGSIGLTYTPNRWQFRTLLSSAFRTPNVDDFAKIFVKDGFISVPNPNLTHEYAYNGELSFGKEFGNRKPLPDGTVQGSNVIINGTGFYTVLKNAIVQQLFCPLDANGEEICIIADASGEENTTVASVNAGSAFVWGLAGQVQANMGNNWHFNANINYTKGRYTQGVTAKRDTLIALSHIPPLFGQLSINFHQKRWDVTTTVRFNGRKKAEDFDPTDNSEDNIAKAIPGYGSPAWTTYNLNLALHMTPKFTINLGVENLLDLHYRPFSSGESAPGRNFLVALRGKF
jgi:hemoglobin/transferrin/lactoferrin receptor protein